MIYDLLLGAQPRNPKKWLGPCAYVIKSKLLTVTVTAQLPSNPSNSQIQVTSLLLLSVSQSTLYALQSLDFRALHFSIYLHLHLSPSLSMSQGKGCSLEICTTLLWWCLWCRWCLWCLWCLWCCIPNFVILRGSNHVAIRIQSSVPGNARWWIDGWWMMTYAYHITIHNSIHNSQSSNFEHVTLWYYINVLN